MLDLSTTLQLTRRLFRIYHRKVHPLSQILGHVTLIVNETRFDILQLLQNQKAEAFVLDDLSRVRLFLLSKALP